ncbi:hypothetical protein QE177_04355 [Arsenophonus sp. aPb]|uniref:hypothetical protein n=1 Tax=Arsenophonus sp. aPb TaxID=3041619 RepID=UPI00246932A3|nr:hypothetical protein [Arsenophonus sp. aPb]WGL99119.1 hypothetical protein QE177_04355 [Arsenophonus sp. aPb]
MKMHKPKNNFITYITYVDNNGEEKVLARILNDIVYNKLTHETTESDKSLDYLLKTTIKRSEIIRKRINKKAYLKNKISKLFIA